MKKNLLLTVIGAIALAAVPKAEAITDSELAEYLDGKLCAQIVQGNYSQNNYFYEHSVGHFRRTGNTSVAVDYFLGYFTVDFNISNNQLVANIVNTSTGKGIDWYGTDDKTSYCEIWNTTMTAWSSNSVQGYPGAVYSLSTPYTFTSTAYSQLGETGIYYFNFNSKPVGIDIIDNGDISNPNYMVYSSIRFYVIEPTAIAITSDGEWYSMDYDINGNTVSFKNLMNIGVGYENDYYNKSLAVKPKIDATISSNNNLTIPFQTIGGFRDGNLIGYGTMTVGWNSYNGYWVNMRYQNNYNEYLGSAIASGNITGKLYQNTIDHYSVKGKDFWAYDEDIPGSGVFTIKDHAITLDKIVIYHQFYSDEPHIANKTWIYKNENLCTHKISIAKPTKAIYGPVGWFEKPENVLWVKGGIDKDSSKNNDYIDHYELYLIPGQISDLSGDVDAETGLVGAMNISDEKYWTGYDQDINKIRTMGAKTEEELEKEHQESIAANSDGLFDRFITDRDMRAAGIEPNAEGKYTIFLKAYYKKETGLAPTFHALTYLGDDTTTVGVSEIEIDNSHDEDAPVIYYNMNGVRMNGDNLAPGIYIKRQGNTATKVVVK